MVEESVEHAFDDLAARRWVEAKLKALALIAATRKGLDSCENELQPDYVDRVRSAVGRAEELAQGDDVSDPSRVRQLQASCAELDEVTKPMAELLMDRAMEAVLRKRGVL